MPIYRQLLTILDKTSLICNQTQKHQLYNPIESLQHQCINGILSTVFCRMFCTFILVTSKYSLSIWFMASKLITRIR